MGHGDYSYQTTSKQHDDTFGHVQKAYEFAWSKNTVILERTSQHYWDIALKVC